MNLHNLRPLTKHPQPTSMINKPPVTINVALFNVRSLLNRTFLMNDVILDHKLDGLLLTETWLGTDTSVVLTEACPPNFNFLFSTREGRRGGGTASIINDSLTSNGVSFNG